MNANQNVSGLRHTFDSLTTTRQLVYKQVKLQDYFGNQSNHKEVFGPATYTSLRPMLAAAGKLYKQLPNWTRHTHFSLGCAKGSLTSLCLFDWGL